MISEKICLSFAPLPFAFFACFLCARLLDWFFAVMSETGEVIIENLEGTLGSCSLNHETETPPNYKTKIFHVGDDNINGKSIIQEFFDCTGPMPINKKSILLETNCYADAIVMLVEKLERKFVHIHHALQNMFYELSNVNHPIAKKIATIILMREFDFIIQEASDIFAFY